MVRVRKNEVEVVAGEMLELTPSAPKEKFSSEYKENYYHCLLGNLHAKGKNEGRAYHLYREKFGVAPAWKKAYAGSDNPLYFEAANYIQRANIAFAKRKAA